MDYNWDVCGQQNIVSDLQKSLLNRTLLHAYIFAGADYLGKKRIADYLLLSLKCTGTPNIPCGKCLNCRQINARIHPDFEYISPVEDGAIIPVDKIRNLVSHLGKKGFSSGYRAAVIERSEKMNVSAANCLLKTLEEAPPETVIILLTSNLHRLLPTLRSRCTVYSFKPLKNSIVADYLQSKGCEKNLAQTYAAACAGRVGLAVRFWKDIDFWQSHNQDIAEVLELCDMDLDGKFAKMAELNFSGVAEKFLRTLLQVFRDIFLVKLGSPVWAVNQAMLNKIKHLATGYEIDELRLILQQIDNSLSLVRQNVNLKLVLGNIFLKIK